MRSKFSRSFFGGRNGEARRLNNPSASSRDALGRGCSSQTKRSGLLFAKRTQDIKLQGIVAIFAHLRVQVYKKIGTLRRTYVSTAKCLMENSDLIATVGQGYGKNNGESTITIV